MSQSRWDTATTVRVARPWVRSTYDREFHLVVLIVCTCVLGLAAILEVREGRQVLIPVWNVPLPEVCSFKRMTGLGCPGCGLTRSFISLAHGQLARAWYYNPAGLLWFGLCAAQIPFRLWQLVRWYRQWPPVHWPLVTTTWIVALLSLAVTWIVRLT